MILIYKTDSFGLSDYFFHDMLEFPPISDSEFYSDLLGSILNRDDARIRILLESPDLNPDVYFYSDIPVSYKNLLHILIINKVPNEIIYILLDKGVNVNNKSATFSNGITQHHLYRSPLHAAFDCGNLELIILLLKTGRCDANIMENDNGVEFNLLYGTCPLYRSDIDNDYNTLLHLLLQDIKINIKKSISDNYYCIFKLLLDNGASLDILNEVHPTYIPAVPETQLYILHNILDDPAIFAIIKIKLMLIFTDYIDYINLMPDIIKNALDDEILSVDEKTTIIQEIINSDVSNAFKFSLLRKYISKYRITKNYFNTFHEVTSSINGMPPDSNPDPHKKRRLLPDGGIGFFEDLCESGIKFDE
jgi:hypothetical protein